MSATDHRRQYEDALVAMRRGALLCVKSGRAYLEAPGGPVYLSPTVASWIIAGEDAEPLQPVERGVCRFRYLTLGERVRIRRSLQAQYISPPNHAGKIGCARAWMVYYESLMQAERRQRETERVQKQAA